MKTLLSVLLLVNLLISDKTGPFNKDTQMAKELLGLNKKKKKRKFTNGAC